MSRVWIIRWDYAGSALDRFPELDQPVVAVLPEDTPIELVAAHAEVVYRSRKWTLQERLDFALGRREDPFPTSINRENRTLRTGHSPYVEGMVVRDPRIIGQTAEETLEHDGRVKG